MKQKKYKRCFSGSGWDLKKDNGWSEPNIVWCSLHSSTIKYVGGIFAWESIEDGQIIAIINGEKITIDQTLITKQFGIGTKNVVDAANALVKEA